jgi:hypothetical protein
MKTLRARLGSALTTVLALRGWDLVVPLLVAALTIVDVWFIVTTPWRLPSL